MCELNLITAEKEKAIRDQNRLVEAPDFSLIYVGKTREACGCEAFVLSTMIRKNSRIMAK